MVLIRPIQTLVPQSFGQLLISIIASDSFFEIFLSMHIFCLSEAQSPLRRILLFDFLSFNFWKRLVMSFNFQHFAIWKRSYYVLEHY